MNRAIIAADKPDQDKQIARGAFCINFARLACLLACSRYILLTQDIHLSGKTLVSVRGDQRNQHAPNAANDRLRARIMININCSNCQISGIYILTKKNREEFINSRVSRIDFQLDK